MLLAAPLRAANYVGNAVHARMRTESRRFGLSSGLQGISMGYKEDDRLYEGRPVG